MSDPVKFTFSPGDHAAACAHPGSATVGGMAVTSCSITQAPDQPTYHPFTEAGVALLILLAAGVLYAAGKALYLTKVKGVSIHG